MPRSKFSAFLSLLLVLVSGVVLGAFSYRLYMVRTVNSGTAVPAPKAPPRLSPDEVLRLRLAEMRDRVKADDQQLAEIRKVYDETRAQYDQIHQRMSEEGHTIDQNQVAKIKQILRPDQIAAYDQLRAEHEAERKRRQQQRDQTNHK